MFFLLIVILPPRSTRTDARVPATTLFRSDRPRALLRERRNGSGGWGRSARHLVRRRPLSAGGLLMLSDKLRVALDNLLPDPGEDESYLRSEEHTSELQSLMRPSSAVFCL